LGLFLTTLRTLPISQGFGKKEVQIVEERTIPADFRTEDKARTIARRLRDLGIEWCTSNRSHLYHEEGPETLTGIAKF